MCSVIILLAAICMIAEAREAGCVSFFASAREQKHRPLSMLKEMVLRTTKRLLGCFTLAPLVLPLLAVPKLRAANRPRTEPVSQLKLRLVYQYPTPVITVRSPRATRIKYGFEGGRALKLGLKYYLFTSEMVGDPRSVKMKLGYWVSKDRIHWRRAGTLFTSSGNFTGADPRAALWAPMPIYNQEEGRWNLFYVAYRAKPDTKQAWYGNYDGTIWRAVSEVKGPAGIGGPYHDVGIILQPGKHSESWEGLQGTDSFFPYAVSKEWYGFYGSAQTQYHPIRAWLVGLARAPRLAGPWVRCAKLNPVPIEPHFIENPVVTRLKSGIYAAVYDNEVPNSIGYTFSADGIHWSRGRSLIVQPKGRGFWSDHVRTPLGLVPEGDHRFTIFYTGFQRLASTASSAGGGNVSSVGWVVVRLEGNP